MRTNMAIALLIAGALLTSIGGFSTAAYAQTTPVGETRGTFSVNMPPGAYKEDSPVFYDPANIAIPAGTTVIWFNSDPNQIHTVTSGKAGAEDAGRAFNSGIMNEGAFYQLTFDKAGEFEYFCQVHLWMVGKVSVSDAFVEGHNLRMGYGAGAVFDFTKNERSLLSFEPTSIEIPEDEPVTYRVMILKNGEEVFSDVFRTLGGNLQIELVPTDGPTEVRGPDISDPVIGAYHILGSFLKDNAAYSVRAEITELFDRPPDRQIGDEFSVQIVPEFPAGTIVPVLAAIGAIVAIGRRRLFGS